MSEAPMIRKNASKKRNKSTRCNSCHSTYTQALWVLVHLVQRGNEVQGQPLAFQDSHGNSPQQMSLTSFSKKKLPRQLQLARKFEQQWKRLPHPAPNNILIPRALNTQLLSPTHTRVFFAGFNIYTDQNCRCHPMWKWDQ